MCSRITVRCSNKSLIVRAPNTGTLASIERIISRRAPPPPRSLGGFTQKTPAVEPGVISTGLNDGEKRCHSVAYLVLQFPRRRLPKRLAEYAFLSLEVVKECLTACIGSFPNPGLENGSKEIPRRSRQVLEFPRASEATPRLQIAEEMLRA
jgi:hypothetical protein